MRSLAFIVLIVLLAVPAYACSCGPKPSISDAVLSADAIFVGRAMKLSVGYRKFEDTEQYREVIECEFRVSAALKGIDADGDTIVIITSSAGPACGYPFRIGADYLVYARAEPKELETNVCTRTRQLVIIDEKQDFSDISKIKRDDAMQTEVPHVREALRKK